MTSSWNQAMLTLILHNEALVHNREGRPDRYLWLYKTGPLPFSQFPATPSESKTRDGIYLSCILISVAMSWQILKTGTKSQFRLKSIANSINKTVLITATISRYLCLNISKLRNDEMASCLKKLGIELLVFINPKQLLHSCSSMDKAQYCVSSNLTHWDQDNLIAILQTTFSN